MDFDVEADLTRSRTLRRSDGWVTIRSGRAEEVLIGGCLETIYWHLKGSSGLLDLTGSILFVETSEEALHLS